MKHNPGSLKLVERAKRTVREYTSCGLEAGTQKENGPSPRTPAHRHCRSEESLLGFFGVQGAPEADVHAPLRRGVLVPVGSPQHVRRVSP